MRAQRRVSRWRNMLPGRTVYILGRRLRRDGKVRKIPRRWEKDRWGLDCRRIKTVSSAVPLRGVLVFQRGVDLRACK